jgi:hypothetical protein
VLWRQRRAASIGIAASNPNAGPLAYLLLRGEGKRRTQASPAGLASFLRVLILQRDGRSGRAPFMPQTSSAGGDRHPHEH